MTISEADALAAHKAIHGGKAEVKLESGEKLPVAKSNLASFKMNIAYSFLMLMSAPDLVLLPRAFFHSRDKCAFFRIVLMSGAI